MAIKQEQFNFDIFPKVVPQDKQVTITIRPLGDHVAFSKDLQYRIRIFPMAEGLHEGISDMWRPNDFHYFVKVDDDGCIRFDHTFVGEQSNLVRLSIDDGSLVGKKVYEDNVFSLAPDLVGLYPFRGDLHMHSCRSDGRESPVVVAANYHSTGYDFMALTDHGRYHSSLELQRYCSKLPLEFTVVTGEEIHLPGNCVHIVNFGSKYSVNGLVRELPQVQEKGEDVSWRALIPDPPPVISTEEYKAEVNALIPELNLPEAEIGDAKFRYAACVWAYRHIQRGGGIAIYAHPYWNVGVWQLPESFTRVMLERHEFDAFEVLGGGSAEKDFQQNQLQSSMYYAMRAKGVKFAVVGSTDSHGSTFLNPASRVASTLIFARENTQESLIEGIRKQNTIAVDTFSGHYRFVGEYRLMRYAVFLMENFFPLHDELCFEAGRALKEYATSGSERALAILECLNGRLAEQKKKYFYFD